MKRIKILFRAELVIMYMYNLCIYDDDNDPFVKIFEIKSILIRILKNLGYLSTRAHISASPDPAGSAA